VDMVAMGWCCSAPKGNVVSSCAGGMAARRETVVCSLASKKLCGGIAGGLPVASQYLFENGGP
jgi:hypothetical protein